VVRGFKKCCVSDKMDGMENEKEVGDAASEHETRWEL
jgi:hypothetical protein